MKISRSPRVVRYFYASLLFFSLCFFYITIFEPFLLPSSWRWRILLLKFSRISHADLGDPCQEGFYPALYAIIYTYRRCMASQMIGRSMWDNLHHAIDYCLDDQLWKVLDVHVIHNWGDTKLAVLPSKNYQSVKSNISDANDCVQVTLGIGKDIAAELRLRKLVPDCHFYGADPVYDSGAPFKEVGKYFQMAVAGKAGSMESWVMENTVYRKEGFKAVSLADFLKSHAKVGHVDYFFLDVEGGEYSVFQELTTGGSVAQTKIPICQISVELHAPLNVYGTNDTAYHQLVSRLLWHSPFIPIWSTGIMTQMTHHMTMYYINAGDPYCVEKYFKNKVCN